jgi:sulfonate transport system permease protein
MVRTVLWRRESELHMTVEAGMRAKTTNVLAGALGIGLLALGADVIGRLELFGNGWPPFFDVLGKIHSDWGFLKRVATVSIVDASKGFTIGLLAGLGLATLGLLVKPLSTGIGRLAGLLNAIPWIAIGPLLVMVVSSSATPIVFAAIAVFFSSFVTISSGFSLVSKSHHDLFQVLGAGRLTEFRRLEIKTAIPSIVYAAKLGAPAAMFGVIFGEWFGTTHVGLGLAMVTALQNYMTLRLWAAAVLAAMISVGGYGIFALIEVAIRKRDYRAFDEVVGSVSAATKEAGHGLRGSIGRVRDLLLHAWPVIGILAFWQYAVSVWEVSQIVAPSPISVLRDIFGNVGTYAEATLFTLEFAILGLLIGTLVGLLAALGSWFSPFLRSVLGAPMIILYSIPLVALVPILARVFGYTRLTETLIAALVSMFPTFVLVSSGLESAPNGANDLFDVIGAKRSRRLWLLAVPSAIPNFLTAFRLTSSLAFIAAILGEYLTGNPGLGWTFALANGMLDMARAWGAALLIVMLSVISYMMASRLEVEGQKRVL